MLKLLDVFVRGEPSAMPRPRCSIIPLSKTSLTPDEFQELRAACATGDFNFFNTVVNRLRNGLHRAHMYYAERYPKDDPAGRGGKPLPWLVWKTRVIAHITSSGKYAQATGPMKLDLDFYFERPERLLTAKASIGTIMHTAKPDTDNLTKLVKDACTECGVWADDAQVCRESVFKDYARRGDPAGCRIVVHQLEQEQPALFDISAKPVETPLHPAVLRVQPTYGRPGPRPMNPNS